MAAAASWSRASTRRWRRSRACADLPRAGVRAAFEQRFTAERMARDYLALYRSLGAEGRGALFGGPITVAA